MLRKSLVGVTLLCAIFATWALSSNWAPVWAGDETPALRRDPRQLSLFVFDLDWSLAKDLGDYQVFRNDRIETPLFPKISGLPEMVRVPVADMEGNVGPRIGKRLGRFDEQGKFVPSASQELIKLSTGESIIPGFYYLDPVRSWTEFRATDDPKQDPFVKAVDKRLKSKSPFLLDAAPFFAATFTDQYADRVRGAVLTMRGHSAEGMQIGMDKIRDTLQLGKKSWPTNAYVNLTNVDFAEFSASKANYLQKAYFQLTRRMMQSFGTPHFLVMFENDRQHLKKVDALFRKLANRGEFANPVVPILVNLVEPEVFAQPDGVNWDANPDEVVTKMSRVTVYWPEKQERTNKLSRVFELTLGQSPADAKATLAKFVTANPLICRNTLVREETGIAMRGAKK